MKRFRIAILSLSLLVAGVSNRIDASVSQTAGMATVTAGVASAVWVKYKRPELWNSACDYVKKHKKWFVGVPTFVAVVFVIGYKLQHKEFPVVLPVVDKSYFRDITTVVCNKLSQLFKHTPGKVASGSKQAYNGLALFLRDTVWKIPGFETPDPSGHVFSTLLKAEDGLAQAGSVAVGRAWQMTNYQYFRGWILGKLIQAENLLNKASSAAVGRAWKIPNYQSYKTNRFTEKETMKLAVFSILCLCKAALLLKKLADPFPGGIDVGQI